MLVLNFILYFQKQRCFNGFNVFLAQCIAMVEGQIRQYIATLLLQIRYNTLKNILLQT